MGEQQGNERLATDLRAVVSVTADLKPVKSFTGMWQAKVVKSVPLFWHNIYLDCLPLPDLFNDLSHGLGCTRCYGLKLPRNMVVL